MRYIRTVQMYMSHERELLKEETGSIFTEHKVNTGRIQTF